MLERLMGYQALLQALGPDQLGLAPPLEPTGKRGPLFVQDLFEKI